MSNEGRVHDDTIEVSLSEVWPSKDKFLCSGAVRLGPFKDCGYYLCLWITVVAPATFFFAVPAAYIWTDISPSIVVVIIGLTICVIALFLASTLSDPGIIPRKEVQVLFGIQHDIRRAFGIPLQPIQTHEKVYIDPVTRKLVLVNPVDEQIYLSAELAGRDYKYCSTCRIIRPPRASHCSVCDNCVLRFDHHCPFINNCVGHRNYVLFGSFIVLALVLGAMILFAVILWSASGNNQWASPTVIIIVSCIVGIPTALVLLLGVALFIYHVCLVCTGQTTRENLTGRTNRQTGENLIESAPWLSNNVFQRPPRLFPPMTTRIRIPVPPV